jgi:hypothetical protein
VTCEKRKITASQITSSQITARQITARQITARQITASQITLPFFWHGHLACTKVNVLFYDVRTAIKYKRALRWINGQT